MQNLQRHIGNIQNKNTAQSKKEKRETRYPPLDQKRNEREYISKLDQTESSALLSIKAEKGNNNEKARSASLYTDTLTIYTKDVKRNVFLALFLFHSNLFTYRSERNKEKKEKLRVQRFSGLDSDAWIGDQQPRLSAKMDSRRRSNIQFLNWRAAIESQRKIKSIPIPKSWTSTTTKKKQDNKTMCTYAV